MLLRNTLFLLVSLVLTSSSLADKNKRKENGDFQAADPIGYSTKNDKKAAATLYTIEAQ